MKRALILGAVIGAGLLAMTVLGQQPPTPPPGAPRFTFPPVEVIEKIADNLYRIPGGGGSSAVWVRHDGVLLVDTKVQGNGPKLLELIRTVTDKPVTHIINTHTHSDHTGSNSFFPARVEVIAQENTGNNMARLDAFKTEDGKVGLPDRTFKDKLTLFKGKDAVDLYYFGPAHTDGDAIVVFRSARVMHAGDIFAAKAQPTIDARNGGNGIAYGETIAKAVARIKNVDKVITGHSDVMTWQDFVNYGEFNRLFLQVARDSLKAGKTPEQAMNDFVLPEKFKDYTLTGVRWGPAGNFPELYAELQQ
jgi:glyoxylase-like metal-dependent hydrolase (beta-lactamase superfamily II)